MSTTTTNLGLFKYDTTLDGNTPFSINTALNNNWDIIDQFSQNIDPLPSQTGNSGKYLTTNGTTPSWGGTMDIYPIIETYSNGADWYRIYSDGFCEQGGLYYQGTTLSGTDNTISFFVTFKDLNYTFTAMNIHSSANINQYTSYEKYTERTVSSTVLRIVAATFGYEWRASGYISED